MIYYIYNIIIIYLEEFDYVWMVESFHDPHFAEQFLKAARVQLDNKSWWIWYLFPRFFAFSGKCLKNMAIPVLNLVIISKIFIVVFIRICLENIIIPVFYR